MLKDVDQRVALLGFIERRPISDALHSVPVKDFYGVLSEARLQFSQLSLRCMIDAEFVHRVEASLDRRCLL